MHNKRKEKNEKTPTLSPAAQTHVNYGLIISCLIFQCFVVKSDLTVYLHIHTTRHILSVIAAETWLAAASRRLMGDILT
jgi:hypothetical protein